MVARAGGPGGAANPGPPGGGDWVQQRYRDNAAAVRVRKLERGRRGRRQGTWARTRRAVDRVTKQVRARDKADLAASRFCETYDFFCGWDSRGPGPWCDLACYLTMLTRYDKQALLVLRHLIVTGRLSVKE